MFTHLFHADWSTTPRKRWAVSAALVDGTWEISAPTRVPEPSDLLSELFAHAEHGAVLAGFDFPIGVAEAYGNRTGERDFPSALEAFGTGRWQNFYDVAASPDQISTERPFYPHRATSHTKQVHLITAHRVTTFGSLRRRCENATSDRRPACPLFWTLGGNQVGKAAISGWRSIVQPARLSGASIWPFDGNLADLARRRGLVIAETYPTEAYGHIGLRFAPNESKTRREDRASKAPAIVTWADRVGARLQPEMSRAIDDGFGHDRSGEDRFDAALGLFGLIEVATGRRPEGANDPATRRWEGWILGQADNAAVPGSSAALY